MKTTPTLLVVEDDREIRETLGEILGAEGYRVLLAEHGVRALEILAAEPAVGLVLLDLTMPVMDGNDFLAEFSQHFPEKAALPILIMTAAGRHEIPSHPLDRILRKPMDVDSLVETVQRYLAIG
jgi:CheY-like chemotaxis protein